MTLSTLPIISVSIAFSPTDIFTTTQTWTDVSSYVRAFDPMRGRQHMLDRFEPGTCTVTVDNRSGYFSTTNQIRTRLPIKIVTNWSSTNYSVFYGLIDSADYKVTDELNTDIDIACSDYLKLLSLTYMDKGSYYGGFVSTGSGNATSWYRMDSLSNPSLANNIGPSATNTIVDSISARNGIIRGPSATVQGALLYDQSIGCDLTNSTGYATAYANLVQFPSANVPYFIDFWILGLNCQNSVLLPVGGGLDLSLTIDGNGFLYVHSHGIITSSVKLNDGNWHHVGYGTDTSTGTSILYAVVDGVSYNLGSSLGFPLELTDGVGNTWLGSNYAFGSIVIASGSPAFAGYVDEVVLSKDNTGGTAIVGEVQARFTAGARMLRAKSSADMVNDILQVAGFGGFTYQYNFTTYTSGQGSALVNGWTNTLTNSTALDLLLTCCDTEIGGFFQQGDGSFVFYGREYPYLAANLTPAFTLTNYDNSYTNQCFYDPTQFQLDADDLDLWTTVKVTPTNGTVQRFDSSTANISKYGTSTLTKSTQPTTLGSAQNEAQYWGFIYSFPITRVANCQISSVTNSGGQLPYMLGAKPFQRVSFVYRDPHGTVNTTPMVIESIQHRFDAEPGTWTTAFVLDPYPVSNATPFMILNDATYGLLNTDLVI